jgi:hypothetical protein
MYSTILLTTLLTALTSASPTLRRSLPPVPSVTFSLANDITGTNVPKTLFADGVRHPLGDIFAGTALIKNGVLTATSGQLTMTDQSVFCVVDDGEGMVWTLNAENTFVDLDGVEGAVETDVGGFGVQCEF